MSAAAQLYIHQTQPGTTEKQLFEYGLSSWRKEAGASEESDTS